MEPEDMATHSQDDARDSVYDYLMRYVAVFERLQERARRHGFNTLVTISTYDPLLRESFFTTSVTGDPLSVKEATRRFLDSNDKEAP